MKLTRKTAAVALASALVLSACSGGDAPEGGTTPTAGTTSETQAGTAGPGEDAATTSAAPDAAASTDDSAGTTAEMTTDPAKAAISVEEAEKIVAEVFEARHASFQEDGKKARKAQKRAFTGSALEAAQAADKLEDVDGEPAEAKAKAPMETNVLAISRADGDLPVFLLVQTVPKDGVPLLHLVASASGKDEDFRIGWESRMLPGTEIPSFDRRSVGSPVLRKGKGDLAQDPHKMLKDGGPGTHSWAGDGGPLIAVKIHLMTRKTLGGLETDLDSRCLAEGGDPIPGLYAAGEAAGFGGGGVHGYNSLEGTFLGGCIFSGLRAGRAMADFVD